MKTMKTLKIPATLALVGYAALSLAQTGPTLYTPVRSLTDQKIKLRSWGSGIITETDDAAFQGSNSIRILSKNFFQGGTLLFQDPVNLAGSFDDKANLLRIVYRPLGTVTSGAAGAPGAPGRGGMGEDGGGMGAPGMGGSGIGGPGRSGSGGMGGPGMGGPGGPGKGGRGGQGGPGGPPGMGGPGMGAPGMGAPGGLPGRGQGSSGTQTDLKTVRLVITTTDDLKSEAYVPVSTSISAEDGWRKVGIPLKAIRGFERTNKKVKEITVSGDSNGSFYLGDLRVVNDPTPIRAEPTERSVNLAVNDIKTLSVRGEGGSSVLRYTWDFDDSDGIGIDAEGSTVQHKFRKPGTYTVTVTVGDEYGLKDPYTTTIKVKVNG